MGKRGRDELNWEGGDYYYCLRKTKIRISSQQGDLKHKEKNKPKLQTDTKVHRKVPLPTAGAPKTM